MQRTSQLFGSLLGLLLLSACGEEPAVKLTYDTSEVSAGAIAAKVTASGTLSATVTVQVGTQVSGRIKELNADFNQSVTKGEVLARLDPQLFEAALEQTRANYTVAKANLTRAEVRARDAQRTLTRIQALFDRKLIAEAELDTARTTAEAGEAEVQAALASVAQTRAAMHQSEINLGYTTVVSPIDGVVISRDVDVGQTVAATLQAPTLFTIAEDLKQMQVNTSVSEADVGRLSAGMNASFTVDAWPGEVFSGSLRQVRNAPRTQQNVVTYDAILDVKNEALKLKPGMTATVTFVVAERQDVLKVANAALRFRPPPEVLEAAGLGGQAGTGGDSRSGDRGSSEKGERRTEAGRGPGSSAGAEKPAAAGAGSASADAGGRADASPNGRRKEGRGNNATRKVWVLNGDKPEPRTITVGISDGTSTEVVSGELKAGDRLITDVSGGKSRSSSGSGPGGMGGMGGMGGGAPGMRRIL